MSRLLLVILTTFIIHSGLSAQTCMKFQEMDKNGLSMSRLDSLYPSAIHAGKLSGVFTGKKEKKFLKTWGTFYEDLMHFMAEHDFKWGQPTYCFNKIYFSKDGKIDYWFFNFNSSDSIPADKQEKYRELITEFSKNYKIKITAGEKFSQCASVTFYDIEEKKK